LLALYVTSQAANNRKSTNTQTYSKENTYETQKQIQNNPLGHPAIEINNNNNNNNNNNM
jgi:hypothetical protein